MTFKKFSDLVAEQFSRLSNGQPLFKSSLDGNKLWELYISSFKPENNPPFRDPNSSTHNCNLDKNFIRRYGNVVAIGTDLKIKTIWDIDIDETSQFYDSVLAMNNALKQAVIQDIFMETFNELNSLPYEKCNKTQDVYRLGIQSNHKMYSKEEVNMFGVVEEGKVYEFNHFYADLPKSYVSFSSESIESIRAEFRDSKNVLKRGLDEIPLDTLELVKDLIIQGSLLNGDTHVVKITTMIPLKTDYDKVGVDDRDNWSWLKSHKLPYAKFRNELIGVLCTELAEGMELNKACLNWNKRVDPANYMKAVAPITKAQISLAKKFVEENGYEESFDRRFAVIEDIALSEIIHAGTQSSSIKKVSIFDTVEKKATTRHKRAEFDGLEEVSIDKFMKDILPSATSVYAMVENRMKGNFVTITTSNNTDSKGIFKWGNNYSWTYNGNLSGKSMIQEAVKSAGGSIEGVLRFSIMWADGDGDNSDLDAHCQDPSNHIYFRNKRSRLGGFLDVDIINPNGKLAVENIVYKNTQSMVDGTYRFYVNQYSARNSKGFTAQIEMNGEVFDYSYSQAVSGNVIVATVTLKNGVFSIQHSLQSTSVSTDIWGVTTQEFAKVNLVSLSPNHWGENTVGDKHYFFMLEGCHSDAPMRSFHNDNLNSDLVPHRKVMDTLASTLNLDPTEQQLAGLGFNSTVRDELIVKVEGSFKRMLKIKF